MLYPTLAAISNVYELAVRQDPDAKKLDPMASWDLHLLRGLDESGFIRSFYK